MDPPSPPAPPDTLTGTVLCIEDNPVSMALVEGLLGRYPAVRLLQATNGVDGLRLAREQRPDLVLLDMLLPDIGGLEVVRALNTEIADRRLRVVLLTAASFSLDVVKAMSLGAQEYWPKPLDAERVASALQRLLRDAGRPRAAAPPGRP